MSTQLKSFQQLHAMLAELLLYDILLDNIKFKVQITGRLEEFDLCI